MVVPSFSAIMQATPSIVPSMGAGGAAALGLANSLGGVLATAGANTAQRNMISGFADAIQGTNPEQANAYRVMADNMPIWVPPTNSADGQSSPGGIRGSSSGAGGISGGSNGSMVAGVMGDMLDSLKQSRQQTFSIALENLRNTHSLQMEHARFTDALAEKTAENQLPPTAYQQGELDNRKVGNNLEAQRISLGFIEHTDTTNERAQAAKERNQEKADIAAQSADLKKRQDTKGTPEYDQFNAETELKKANTARAAAEAIKAGAEAQAISDPTSPKHLDKIDPHGVLRDWASDPKSFDEYLAGRAKEARALTDDIGKPANVARGQDILNKTTQLKSQVEQIRTGGDPITGLINKYGGGSSAPQSVNKSFLVVPSMTSGPMTNPAGSTKPVTGSSGE